MRRRAPLLLVLLTLLAVVAPAIAQGPPVSWHPYRGAVNSVQVADAQGNFNCYPGATIDPLSGAMSFGLREANVLTCGAKGDAVTDDSAVIQACIDALPDGAFGSAGNRGGVVRFPRATYNLGSSGIVLTQQGITLMGDGRDNSILVLSSSQTPWAALTAYTVGQIRSNGGQAYIVLSAGTSAGSGGPTGTTAGVLPPTLAPGVTLAGAGAGNVDFGTHVYCYTYMTSNTAETPCSPVSVPVNITLPATNGQVLLTITTGAVKPVEVFKRNIYRSKAGTTTPLFLVSTSPVVNNNTATSYTDNIADASLSATVAPTANTSGTILDGTVLWNFRTRANTVVGNSGPTVRTSNRIEKLALDITDAADGATCLDFTYFSYAYYGRNFCRASSGASKVGFYGTGTVLAGAPFYSVFEQNDVQFATATWGANTTYTVGTIRRNGQNWYVVTVAGTSAGAGGPTGTGTGIVDNTVTWDYTHGGIAYLFDQGPLAAGNATRGPNGDSISGGRLSGGEIAVDVRSGNGNFIGPFNCESVSLACVRLGTSTSVYDLSGTATAGTANTITVSGTPFTGLTLSPGMITLTGGTGSGQVREITSSGASTVTVRNNWLTTPDATTTYTVARRSTAGTAVSGIRMEGTAAAYLLRIEGTASSTLVGVQPSASSAAGDISQALFRFTDSLRVDSRKDPVPLEFAITTPTVDGAAHAMVKGGGAGTSAEYLMSSDCELVAVSIRLESGSGTAGTFVVTPTVQGAAKTLTARLDFTAGITGNDSQNEPIGTEGCAGIEKRVGLNYTATGWTSSGANKTIHGIVWVIPK